MEVNARIQVEHPVSEYVSGVDIIREQIMVCTGEKMETNPATVSLQGWSIEARINARAPGIVSRLEIPGGPGVRFDSFIYQGYKVLPHYDSMIAKLIVHDVSREKAVARLLRALDELVIDGVPTNKEEQIQILNAAQFVSGNFGTSLYAELFGGK